MRPLRGVPTLAVFLALLLGVRPAPGASALPDVTIGYVSGEGQVVQLVGRRFEGRWEDGGELSGLWGGTWKTFAMATPGPELATGALMGEGTGSLIFPVVSPVPVEGVAVLGGRPTQPRHGQAVDPGDLIGPITRLLVSRRVAIEQARVTQCVAVDLYGDGRTEWLICASSQGASKDPTTRTPLDYSLAAIGWRTPIGALYVDPVEIETTLAPGTPGREYRFVGLVDVEGKGHMDFGLYAGGYESGSMGLYGFDGKRAFKRIEATWGM
jgi:hypothetical protein